MSSSPEGTVPQDIEMGELRPPSPTQSDQPTTGPTSSAGNTSGGGSTNSGPSNQEAFIHANNFEPYPLGWPKLAAQQNYYANGSIHRRFGYLFQRAMAYSGGRLTWLEKLLMETDKKASKEQLTTLSPAQKRDVIGGEDRQDEKQAAADDFSRSDALLEEIITALLRHAPLMLYDKDLRALPRISVKEHRNQWDHVRRKEMLDKDGKLILQYPNDCVTTSGRDRIQTLFKPLFYGRLRNLLASLSWKENKKGDESSTARDGSYAAVIPTSLLGIVLNTAIVVLCPLVLLLPVIVLYLFPLTKILSVVVTTAFVFFFAICMVLTTENLDTIFVAICAYMAVLATFLANLQGPAVAVATGNATDAVTAASAVTAYVVTTCVVATSAAGIFSS